MKKKKIAKKTVKGIIPLGDRVLVRPYTEEELSPRTASGIIIPDTISREKSAQGKVIAVGEGKYEDSKLVPMKVRVGETVVFSKYGYDEVEHNGEEYYLLKEENILAVIK